MHKRKVAMFVICMLMGTTMPVMAAKPEDVPVDQVSEQKVVGENGEMDTRGLVLNTEALDAKYEEMLWELKEYGFGEEFSMKRSQKSGYSMDAVQLFQNTYGDLWQEIQLGEVKLPEDFSVSESLQEGMSMRNKMFADIQSSQMYQDVMGRMDISGVWAKASGGLPSAESLMTNNYAKDFQGKAQSEKNQNENSQAELQEGSLKLFTESGKLLGENSKNSFWSAVEDMRDIISQGEDGVEDIFDQMK